MNKKIRLILLPICFLLVCTSCKLKETDETGVNVNDNSPETIISEAPEVTLTEELTTVPTKIAEPDEEVKPTKITELPATKIPEVTAAAEPTESPKATETAESTESPKATEALKPTESPKATEAPKPTESPKATEAAEPTESPKATEVPKPTESPKATATPKPTESPKATATPKPTESPKATATPKPTESPKATATPKPTESPKATATPKPTESPKATATPKPTESPKATATPKPTESPKPTATPKPTESPNPTTEPTEAPVSEGTSATINSAEISLGMTVDELNNILGKASYNVPAEYKDCEWYVYNADYSSLVLALVKNNTVVGLFVDGRTFKYDGITTASGVSDIKEAGFENRNPSKEFLYERKDTTVYARVYTDNLSDSTAEGVYFSYKDVEATMDYTSCENSYEILVFEITNSFRSKNGIPQLVYDDAIAETARKHSKDMIDRNFFSHYNPDGLSPFERMNADGILYSYAGENIAAGYDDPMEVVYGWINSSGHRSNLLSGNFTRLGVGVVFGGSYRLYYTQNFYTPR